MHGRRSHPRHARSSGRVGLVGDGGGCPQSNNVADSTVTKGQVVAGPGTVVGGDMRGVHLLVGGVAFASSGHQVLPACPGVGGLLQSEGDHGLSRINPAAFVLQGSIPTVLIGFTNEVATELCQLCRHAGVACPLLPLIPRVIAERAIVRWSGPRPGVCLVGKGEDCEVYRFRDPGEVSGRGRGDHGLRTSG